MRCYLKLNNQSGYVMVEVIILIAITAFIFSLMFSTTKPSTPGIETKTTAIVLGTETTTTIYHSKLGDTEYYHCDIFVKPVSSETQLKFRFDVDSPSEAKIYCNSLTQDKKYSFSHYEYPEDAKLITVFDYELIETP